MTFRRTTPRPTGSCKRRGLKGALGQRLSLPRMMVMRERRGARWLRFAQRLKMQCGAGCVCTPHCSRCQKIACASRIKKMSLNKLAFYLRHVVATWKCGAAQATALAIRSRPITLLENYSAMKEWLLTTAEFKGSCWSGQQPPSCRICATHSC